MSRLRVYKLSLEMVRLMRPLWEKIGRNNRPLRQQLEKSVPAVPRLIAEGEARRTCWAQSGSQQPSPSAPEGPIGPSTCRAF